MDFGMLWDYDEAKVAAGELQVYYYTFAEVSHCNLSFHSFNL